ncbi:MAG: hypothetical protein OHK0037_35410 [Elainellaceae cyanobacterium]
MVSFQQEVQAATDKSEAESLKQLIQPLVDEIVAATIGKMAGADTPNPNAGRALQLRLRGYEMADPANHALFHQKKTEMREAIAATGLPIKASQGKKYSPQELLAILEARCEALRTCGARDLATSIRASDDLANLKKVLATGNAAYITDQVDRVLAVSGLLYG